MFRRASVSVFLFLAGCVVDDDVQLSSIDQNAFVDSTTIWGSPTLSLCFTQTGYAGYRLRTQRTLADTWAAESALVYTGFGTCGATSANHKISFIYNTSSVSLTHGQGSELDNLNPGMELNTYGASDTATTPWNDPVHEFGHALGLAHEDLRSDTPSACTPNPEPGGTGDTEYGAWDQASVMDASLPCRGDHSRLSPGDAAFVDRYYGAVRPVVGIDSSATGTTDETDQLSRFRSTGWLVFKSGSTSTVLYSPDNQRLTSGPSLARYPTPAAVARTSVGNVGYIKELAGHTWSAWTDLGQPPAGAALGQPIIVSRPLGATGGTRVAVVVRNGADGISIREQNTNGTWQSWVDVVGDFVGQPSAVVRTDNSLVIAATGYDSTLKIINYVNSGSYTVTNLGGVIYGSPSAVLMRGTNHVYVLATAADNTLSYRDSTSGTTWNAWTQVITGGGIAGSPSAVSRAANMLDVFYRDAAGDIWTSWYNTAGGWGSGKVTGSGGPAGVTILSRGSPAAFVHGVASASSYSISVRYRGSQAGFPSFATDPVVGVNWTPGVGWSGGADTNPLNGVK